MYDVNGSRAIITGSAQGFGKEFALRLLQKGCKVCLSDIDESKGLETKLELQKQFGFNDDSVCFVKCNVALRDGSWNELWDSAEKNLKGPIDILINNAGLNPIHGWQKNLDVMLMGAVRGVFTAIDKMGRSKGGRGGRIINVASIAGLTPPSMGDLNCAGYGVAKHGIVSMTRSFLTSDPKVYDSEGIKCYALCPTFADTNLVRSSFVQQEQLQTKLTVRGKIVKNVDELSDLARMRLLTVEDVGNAMLKSLEYDKDGALYAVFPDQPLIQWPDDESFRFFSLVLANKFIGSRLNIELFTKKHFYVITMIFIFIIFYVMSWILQYLF